MTQQRFELCFDMDSCLANLLSTQYPEVYKTAIIDKMVNTFFSGHIDENQKIQDACITLRLFTNRRDSLSDSHHSKKNHLRLAKDVINELYSRLAERVGDTSVLYLDDRYNVELLPRTNKNSSYHSFMLHAAKQLQEKRQIQLNMHPAGNDKLDLLLMTLNAIHYSHVSTHDPVKVILCDDRFGSSEEDYGLDCLIDFLKVNTDTIAENVSIDIYHLDPMEDFQVLYNSFKSINPHTCSPNEKERVRFILSALSALAERGDCLINDTREKHEELLHSLWNLVFNKSQDGQTLLSPLVLKEQIQAKGQALSLAGKIIGTGVFPEPCTAMSFWVELARLTDEYCSFKECYYQKERAHVAKTETEHTHSEPLVEAEGSLAEEAHQYIEKSEYEVESEPKRVKFA